MEPMRTLDAYCASCDQIGAHTVTWEDPGSCSCNSCGETQPLFSPLAPEPVTA